MEKNTNPIKIGEVFFLKAKALSSWSFRNVDGNISAGCINDFMKFNWYDSNFENFDGLIAVKYLGNGIVEEMLTGQSMLLSGKYSVFSGMEAPYEDKDIAPFASKFEFISYHNPNVESARLTPPDLTDAMHSFDEIISLYPITVKDSYSHIEKLSDRSKKEYLRYSESFRLGAIHEFIKTARENVGHIHTAINAVHKQISPYMNLEEQLNRFANSSEGFQKIK